MLNLFYVESPFQLICANERIGVETDSKVTNILIIRNNLEIINNFQMNSTLKKLNINAKVIFFPMNRRSLIFPFQYLNFFISYFKIFLIANKIFIGNVESSIGKLFILFFRKKLTILDDGLKSLSYRSSIQNINYFTMIDDGLFLNSNIELNKFSLLRSLTFEPIKIQRGTAFFLGDKFTEDGIFMLREYKALVDKALDFLASKYSKVIYIPHRGEDWDECVALFSRNNIAVRRLELDGFPVELSLVSAESIPECIGGFFSAALYSVHTLFPNDLEIVSFKSNSIIEKFPKSELVYLFLSKKIKIINVN